MTYDHWKTTNPDDEQYVPPPCETKPDYDDNDVCQYCGAEPTRGCRWEKS